MGRLHKHPRISHYSFVYFGVPGAISADIIPAIAWALAASVDKASIQARDEEAAAMQCQPHTKKLIDERSLRVIEEDAAAPSPSSLPSGR